MTAVRLPAADFFVSPTGTPTADGSRSHPWDLATAVQDNTVGSNINSVVKPGDTIWLLGGRYGTGANTSFYCKLWGNLTAPVVVRQFPGDHSIVDGGINAAGGYTTFWGFEIMNSSPNRLVTPDMRPVGLNFGGKGLKAINLVIHDTGHPGIGFWLPTGEDGGEVYGCVIWGVGLYDLSFNSGQYRGAGIYAQNQFGLPSISDVIAFKNFTEGIKLYAEQNYVNGFQLEGNVAFLNFLDGYLADDLHYPMKDLRLAGNHSFNNNTSRIGISGINHQNVQIYNNYFVDDALGGYTKIFACNSWTDFTMQNNSFAEVTTSTNTYPPGSGVTYLDSLCFWDLGETNVPPQNVNGNSYYGGNDVYGNLFLNGTRTTFESVRTATGWESSGRFYTNALPTDNLAVLRPNKYEPGRAHLIVYNWAGKAAQTVDLSSVGLATGAHFEIRDVQNFLGTPVYSGTYDASNPRVDVPLTGTAVTPLIGSVTHFKRDPNQHTSPLFNVFVILPVVTGSGGNLLSPGEVHIYPDR